MRPTLRNLLLVSSLLVPLSGCGTRDLTPWFRVVTGSAFDEAPDAPYSEQLIRGRWVRVSHNAEARTFQGGALVLYRTGEYMLTNERGEGATLACGGDFSVLPGETGFACVQIGSHAVRAEQPLHVGHRVYDLKGEIVLDDDLVLPAGMFGRDYDTHMLGIDDDGTPYVAVRVIPDAREEAGDLRACILFAVRPGEMKEVRRVVTTQQYSCPEPAFWSTSELHILRRDTL